MRSQSKGIGSADNVVGEQRRFFRPLLLPCWNLCIYGCLVSRAETPPGLPSFQGQPPSGSVRCVGLTLLLISLPRNMMSVCSCHS